MKNMHAISLVCIFCFIVESSSASTKYSIEEKHHLPSVPKVVFPQQKEMVEKSTDEAKVDPPFTGQHASAPTRITNCGAAIRVGSAVIEYKYNTTYDNSELCVWTIRNADAAFFVFRLYETDMEKPYDFVQVTIFAKEHNNVPSGTYILTPGEISLAAPLALVTFSTDASVVRRGFKLSISTFGSPAYNYSYMDLHSWTPNGRLQLLTYYNNMMRTFFVSPKSASRFILSYETESCCDHISAFKVERNSSQNYMTYRFINRYSGKGSASYDLTVSPYPSAILYIFTSDHSVVMDAVNQLLWL